MKIKQLISTDPDFSKQLQSLLSRSNEKDTELSAIVSSILEDVRNRGDEALLEYTNKYDHRSASKDDLEVIPSLLDEAVKQIPNELLQGLRTAAVGRPRRQLTVASHHLETLFVTLQVWNPARPTPRTRQPNHRARAECWLPHELAAERLKRK